MQTTRIASRAVLKRNGVAAERAEGESRAYGAPARVWRARQRRPEQAVPSWSPEGLRRCAARLAGNVNALHPKAKTRLAMRVLDTQVGFENPLARRLGRYYDQPVPSALLFGLEPGPAEQCASCPAAGNCLREGSGYQDLARAVTEAGRLGVRLFLAAGPKVGVTGHGAPGSGAQGAARYWPELLDLALRNPDRTFLVFTGGFVPDAAAAAEAAAAGNLGFVLSQGEAGGPGAGAGDASRDQGASAEGGEVRRQELVSLRAAGAPFGFAAGLASGSSDAMDEAAWESWVEGMLEQGYLFGFLYPVPRAGAVQTAGDAGRAPEGPGWEALRLRAGSPMPLFDLHGEAAFTDEPAPEEAFAEPRLSRGLGGPARTRLVAGSRNRGVLLVHPVTPLFRSLTLLESLETAALAGAAARPAPADRASAGPPLTDPAPACPLLLGRGNSRGVVYALLAR